MAPAAQAKIVEAYEAGEETGALAKRFGLNRVSIRNVLLRNAVALRPRRPPIESLEAIVKMRGGEVLSASYQHAKSKVLVSCGVHGEFEISVGGLRGGQWCRKCFNETVRRHRLMPDKDVAARAAKYGFNLMRWELRGPARYLLLQCGDKHEPFWMAMGNLGKAGCPSCSSALHLGEAIARGYLELLTGKKFPGTSPRWLAPLRFDGYCAELHLAFEYHGMQHFEFPNPFHRTRAQFQLGLRRDDLKRSLAEANSTRIVEIPHTVKHGEMGEFIRGKLVSMGYELLAVGVMPTPQQLGVSHLPYLARLKAAVASQGGVLLTEAYLGYDAKVRVRCARGHEWEARPATLIGKNWCPTCRGRISQKQKGVIARMRAVGRPQSEIARDAGTTVDTVKEWTRKLGLETKREFLRRQIPVALDLRRKGMTVQEILQKTGVGIGSFYKAARAAGMTDTRRGSRKRSPSAPGEARSPPKRK